MKHFFAIAAALALCSCDSSCPPNTVCTPVASPSVDPDNTYRGAEYKGTIQGCKVYSLEMGESVAVICPEASRVNIDTHSGKIHRSATVVRP